MARVSVPEILRHPTTSRGRALAIANIGRELSGTQLAEFLIKIGTIVPGILIARSLFTRIDQATVRT